MADPTPDPKPDPPVDPAIAKLTAESAKYHDRAQKAESALAETNKRLGEIEATQKAATEAAEQAALEGQGKYDEALAKQKASMQTVADGETTRADSAESRLRQIFGTDALKTELGAKGVKPELIDQAATLLRGRVTVDLSGEKPSVTVMDAEGQPAFTEGNPADITSLVVGWLPDNKHFLPPTGDGGTGLHPGGSPGDNAGLTQKGLLADPNKHQQWIATFPPGEAQAAFSKLPRK